MCRALFNFFANKIKMLRIAKNIRKLSFLVKIQGGGGGGLSDFQNK